MATPRQYRVGGSRFTLFEYNGSNLLNCEQVSHQSPQPVAQVVPIQPLDSAHPQEIITPAAASMGTLVLRIYEVYGRKVWDDLAGLTGLNDIVEIFNAVANSSEEIKVKRYVVPPGGSGVQPYYDLLHGCVIGNVDDSETIQIGTMQVTKDITVNYTHYTRAATGATGAQHVQSVTF